MSVSHTTFGCRAVNSRSTRSSCTGGPALRAEPLFFANTDQIPCCVHSRCTRFSDAMTPPAASSSAMNRYPNAGSS